MRINKPIDPVIRKRVHITEDFDFIKWLSILSIVICGGIYVFLGSVQPLIVNPDDSLNTVQITAPDKIVNVSIGSIQKANPNDISEKLLKNYSDSQPIKLTPVAMNIPAETHTALVIKPTPIVDTIPISNVKLLLNKAHKQIAMKRLTSPKDNNAYSTYQIILKEYPQQAQKILDDIVAWYFEQGINFISKNRLTTKLSGRDSAYKMYKKLSKIAPNHQNTKALFNEIITKLNIRAKQQLDKSVSDAYATYNVMLEIAPDNQNTKNLLTKITDNLFAKAQKQIVKQLYSTPKDNNAVATFKQILAIVPDNTKAQKGLKKIVKKYHRLSLQKYNQGRYKSSMIWLERGLQVSSNDPELNKLKQQIIEKIN